MKKIFSIIAMAAILAACSNEDDFTVARMVTVTLDCAFDVKTTRGSETLYTQLYDRIASKELIADKYNLVFTNKETGEKSTLYGNWSDNTQFEIKTGNYTVQGGSTAEGVGIQDKCSISFNTEVSVTSNTNRLILKADYDCFLIIFDKRTVKDASITYLFSSNLIERHFFEYGGMLYGFSGNLYNDKIAQYQKLRIEYTDGSIEERQSSKLNTKKGEYYIIEGTRSSSSELLGNSTINFTIGQMRRGQL